MSNGHSFGPQVRPLFEPLERRLLLDGTPLAETAISPDLRVAEASPEVKPIIIDMDPSFDKIPTLYGGPAPEGVCDPDDILALIYAAQSPYAELKGVTVGWGNMWDYLSPGMGVVVPPVEYYEAEAQEALDRLGPDGAKVLDYFVPVLSGAGFLQTWHFLGINPLLARAGIPLIQPQPTAASWFMGNTVAAHASMGWDKITIIAQGTLTNLATAMYYYEGPSGQGPDAFMNDVEEIWIIGGAVAENHDLCVPGNVVWTGMQGEYNIWRDPNAAEYVFACVNDELKVNMVPLDMTMDGRIYRDEERDPKKGWQDVLASETPIAKFISPVVEDWMHTFVPGIDIDTPVWFLNGGFDPFDTIGVAVALDPSIAQAYPNEVPISVDYLATSRTLPWALDGRGPVRIYYDFCETYVGLDPDDSGMAGKEVFKDRFFERMIGPAPTVEGSPDYVVLDLTPDGPEHPLPDDLGPDSNFHVLVTTWNRGNGDAPGDPETGPSSRTTLYLSPDDDISGSGNDIWIGEQEVAPLAIDGRETSYVGVSLAGKGVQEGMYYLGAIADVENVVHEGFLGELHNDSMSSHCVIITQEEPAATLLSSGIVNSMTGIEGDTFTYDVTYTHPNGQDPKYVFVTLDGDHTSLLMHKVSGDSTSGALYRASTDAIPQGTHTYHFTAYLEDGTTARYPASGILHGPFVNKAEAMRVSILPREYYDVGDEVWLDIEIRDPNGNWYDPDGEYPVQVGRMPGDIWFGYRPGHVSSIVRTGVGRYYLRCVQGLVEGCTTFTCIADGTQWLDTAVSIQFVRGDIPELDPIQISDVVVEPAIVTPGIPTELCYSLSNEASVTIRILDPEGDVLRTLVDHDYRAGGSHAELWDGRAGAGQYVSGEYQVRIEALHVGNIENVACFGPSGRGYGELLDPKGIWVQEGQIYVVDYDARYHETWKGQILRMDTSLVSEFGDDTIFAPQDIALDSQGNIYVISTHTYNPVVRVFDNDGTYVRSFGQGTIAWDYDPAITTDSEDNVYVGCNQTVYKFSSAGALLNSFAVSSLEQNEFITGIAVDANGRIWIASYHAWIKSFDQAGNELQSFWGGVGHQAGISVRGDGLVFVKGDDGFSVFDADGTHIHDSGYVHSDSTMNGIFAADDGYVYVTASTSGGDWTLSRLWDPSSKDTKLWGISAVISSPSSSGVVDGHVTPSLTITGTATDSRFSHYVVEWRSESGPGGWHILAVGMTPVAEGELATWDLEEIPSGTYAIRLSVYDLAGIARQAQATFEYLDATSPAATIAWPVDGTTTNGTVMVEAGSTASDIQDVAFQFKPVAAGAWSLIGRDYTYPYSALWNTTGLSSGDYHLRAVATDTVDNTDSMPEAVTVSVDNTPPSASIVTPPDGSEVSSEVVVSVASTDADLESVVLQYRREDTPYWLTLGFAQDEESEWVFDWDPDGLVGGVYQIRAVGWDELGNFDSDPETITVILMTMPMICNWRGTADNHWENPSNWSPPVDLGPETTAHISGAVSEVPRIYQEQEVRGLDFANGNCALEGSGPLLTLGVNGIDSAGSGTNTVYPNVAMADDSTWTIAGENTLTLSGSLSGGGHTLTKDGQGTLVVAGGQDHGTGLSLAIDGGMVELGDAQTLVLDSLAIAIGSALDLTTGNLIVDYDAASPYDAIEAWVTTGFNDGQWNSSGTATGITTANGDATNYALAIVDNNDPDGGGLTELGGAPVDATSVLVRRTFYADADLNGQLDAADVNRLVLSFGGLLTDPAPRWASCDYNYDNLIDAADVNLLVLAFANHAGETPAGGQPAPVSVPLAPHVQATESPERWLAELLAAPETAILGAQAIEGRARAFASAEPLSARNGPVAPVIQTPAQEPAGLLTISPDDGVSPLRPWSPVSDGRVGASDADLEDGLADPLTVPALDVPLGV